jgi:signal transduction histidine kinase
MPIAEQERLDALHRYDILDTPPEHCYDDLVAMAALICDTPVAMMNLIDERRQWGKALYGLPSSEAPREISFCAHAILAEDDLMVVPDTLDDARFTANPLVTPTALVRFYAGARIVSPDGHAVGTICVAAPEPRELDESQAAALRALARQAAGMLELRVALAREEEQQRRLRELEEIRAEFVTFVSHEMRTPLTSIRGYLECVMETPERLDREQLHFLTTVARNSDRLNKLVDDLVEFMRMEGDGLVLNTEHTDLAALTAEAVGAIAPTAQRKRLALTLAPAAPHHVEADAARIGQVIDNLLANAVKYTPAGGRVEVSVERDGEAAVVRVADSGIGIPESERDRVFERFFRSSVVLDHNIPGTGLGLAISRRIVDAHGGWIGFAPRDGGGTEFSFALSARR